ncbi:MAG: hypothetical protein ABFC28_10615 [Rikenellaceae bacterium]
MKNIKYIISLVFLLALVSCDKDAVMTHVDSEEIGSVGAAFSSTVLVYNLTSADNNVLKVLVYRGNTTAAASVPVTIASSAPSTLTLFTLPSGTVEFAAGEGKAYVSVSYNMASVAPGTTYTFTLNLVGDDLISPSKVSSISVRAQLPIVYNSIGTGSYSSEFYEATWDQEVQKANLPSNLPSFYRLPGCYYAGYNIDFKVSDGVITIASQNVGELYSTAYGYIYVTPQSTSIEGKTYGWYSKFTLPTAGLAFSGTYWEKITMP